uniref:uncharacterized protein LOC120336065 n=1 Tax=Styela clava TaxID=7725 RepID=UPI0019392CCE|nr:uncharacterized protein LOC120336065 [Styela clava]
MDLKLSGHILLSLFHLLSQSKHLFVNAQDPAKTKKTDDGYLLERFDTEVQTMNAAEQECKARSAWLVRIKDKNMQDEVKVLLDGATASNSTGDYFIGLTKSFGYWTWSDGVRAVWPMNWAWNEGNDGSICVAIRHSDEKWTDITCTANRRYICQSDLLTITPTNKVMVVVRGNTASINVKIHSSGGAVRMQVFKLPNKTNSVRSISGVISSYTYNTTPINDFQYVIYEFVVTLTVESKSYTKLATVRLNVHYPVNITNIFPTAISSPVTSGLQYVTCEASGAPSAQVVWIRNGRSVPLNGDSFVYQWKSTGKSILYIMNAVLSDTGTYTCRATNNIGEPAQETKDEREIELSVYGSPVITDSKVVECSVGEKIPIEWKPNYQTIGVVHRISATREGDTVAIYTQNITAQTHEITTIEKLAPYTNYTIKITVCPDECITKLHAQTVIKTGIGLPDPVTNARVTKVSESHCAVTWDWSETKLKTNETFEIIENATLVFLSSNIQQHTFTKKYLYEGKSLDSFRVQIETKPNRNYTFYVNAKNCAGESNRIAAIGECLTNVAAPEHVPVPTTVQTEENSATQLIDITFPDETRGPIGCLLVIVKSGESESEDEITMEKLTRLSKNALIGKSEENEFLAIAMQRSKIKDPKVQVSLGDDKASFCHLLTGTTRAKRAVTEYISGRNLPLKIGSTYTYYAVTSTYSVTSGEVLLQRSSSAAFNLKKTEGSNIVWIAAVVVGALVIAVVVVLISTFSQSVLLVRKKRNVQKEENDDHTYEQPSINPIGI